jgi:hypothetical protein
MVLFCVVLVCVGGWRRCTSTAPHSLAPTAAYGASHRMCMTACAVAVCVVGSGGCGVGHYGGPFVFVCDCAMSHITLPSPPLPMFPALPPCGFQMCASSSLSCELRVVASQREVGDHTPPTGPLR